MTSLSSVVSRDMSADSSSACHTDGEGSAGHHARQALLPGPARKSALPSRRYDRGHNLAILEDPGRSVTPPGRGSRGREERVTPFAMPTLAAPLSLAVGDINLNVMFEGYAPFSWASPDARLASQTRLRLSRTRSSQQDAHVRLAA